MRGASMRRDASNKKAVGVHLARIQQKLDDPRLADALQRAAAQVAGDAPARDKISALLSPDIDAMASSGGEPGSVPYLSRAPLVSLVQSHLEDALGSSGVRDPAEHQGLLDKIVRAVQA